MNLQIVLPWLNKTAHSHVAENTPKTTQTSHSTRSRESQEILWLFKDAATFVEMEGKEDELVDLSGDQDLIASRVRDWLITG